MTTYGVTDDGFVIKPLDVIKDEIEEQQRADIAAALNQTATSVLGQLNGIFSAKAREVWELAEAVYNAFDPDAAEGSSLDNDVALCPGIIRLAATKSRVTATCNLDPGTYLAGTLIAHVVGDTTARFVSIEDATNGGGGAADIPVVMEAEETGEVVALSGTLTVIAEPVTGWNSVTNASDAEVGSPLETDAELRLRREEELRLAGSTHVDAIKADVLEVDGVISAVVFENVSDVVVDGMKPHSIRVVIWAGDPPGATDADVAQAIYDSKAAGIDTNGARSADIEDTMGYDHTIYYDRATEKAFEVRMTAVTDDPPTDWQDQIKAALLAYAAGLTIGDDVIYVKALGDAQEFDWLVDFTTFEIRLAGGSWGEVNLVIDNDEQATLDSSNITFL